MACLEKQLKVSSSSKCGLSTHMRSQSSCANIQDLRQALWKWCLILPEHFCTFDLGEAGGNIPAKSFQIRSSDDKSSTLVNIWLGTPTQETLPSGSRWSWRNMSSLLPAAPLLVPHRSPTGFSRAWPVHQKLCPLRPSPPYSRGWPQCAVLASLLQIWVSSGGNNRIQGGLLHPPLPVDCLLCGRLPPFCWQGRACS